MAVPKVSNEGFINQGDIGENVEIQVHLTLPFTVKNHNGIYEGDTITWNIDPYKENYLNFTYVKNELYKPLILLILTAGLCVAIVVKKKNKPIPRKEESK